MTKNRNIGLLLIATLLTAGMSGIAGAAYDEDGNYIEDIPVWTDEPFVYVVYPFDMSANAAYADAYAEPYFDATTSYVVYPFDMSAYVDMTIPGVQGIVGEEE